MNSEDRARTEDEYFNRVRDMVTQRATRLDDEQARSLAQLQDQSNNLAADLHREFSDLQPPAHLTAFHRNVIETVESWRRTTPQAFDRQSQKWLAILYLTGFPLPDLAGPIDTMAVVSDFGTRVAQSSPATPPSLVELLTELKHPDPEGALARRTGRPSLDPPW